MPGRDAWLRAAAVAATVVGLGGVAAGAFLAVVSARVDWLDVGFPWQLVTSACTVAGALIALSRPTHPVGWLFLSLGAFEPLTGAIATLRSLSLDGPSWWITSADVVASAETPTIPIVLLLFPTGRLLSRPWRIGVGLALAAALTGATAALVNGGWGGDPVAGDRVSPAAGRWPLLGEVLPRLYVSLLASALVISGVSLVVRYRHSRGEERLQLRWLAAAGALLVLTAPSYFIGLGNDTVVTTLFAVNLGLIPLAVGIAVLQYRLYDIDVVINRTLVYAGLTATLAATYLASVLALQLTLRPVTDRSDLAVAGSTLAVAALFRPVRARIQGAVDHRFYRRRYDAERTLEAFTGRLRDQLDLGALHEDLYRAVRDTVQPAHPSLWLRETP